VDARGHALVVQDGLGPALALALAADGERAALVVAATHERDPRVVLELLVVEALELREAVRHVEVHGAGVEDLALFAGHGECAGRAGQGDGKQRGEHGHLVRRAYTGSPSSSVSTAFDAFGSVRRSPRNTDT